MTQHDTCYKKLETRYITYQDTCYITRDDTSYIT